MHRHDHRVDPDEAQEIVRLAAERQSSAPNDGPTVSGLAEALSLPPEEIERLLAEVRSRRNVVPERGRTFGDRSAAISAAIALVLLIVAGGFGFAFMRMKQQPNLPVFATTVPDDGIVGEATVSAAPPVPDEPAVALDISPNASTGENQDLLNEQRRKLDLLRKKVSELERKAAEVSNAELDRQIAQVEEQIAHMEKERAATAGK